MYQKTMVAAIVAVIALSSPLVMGAGAYTEQWDSGSLAGWHQNTIETTVEYMATGGNGGGYVKTYGDTGGTYDIGAQISSSSAPASPFVGDYIAGGITGCHVDLSFVYGQYDGVMLRFRYESAAYNGWYYPLSPQYIPSWQTFSTDFDPSWTDAEARANGWLADEGANPSISFAQTMGSVYAVDIRLSGTDYCEGGIDNFGLRGAEQFIPAPGALLLGVIGLVSCRFRRRR